MSSQNFLDSGAIYNALQYKSDLDHTHTLSLSSVIDLEDSLDAKADLSALLDVEEELTGKADLNHSHTELNNDLRVVGTIRANDAHLYIQSGALIIPHVQMTTYDRSKPATQVENNHHYIFNVTDKDNSMVFSMRAVDEHAGNRGLIFRFNPHPSGAVTDGWTEGRSFKYAIYFRLCLSKNYLVESNHSEIILN